MIGSLRAARVSDRPVVEASSAPGYEPIFNAGLLYHEGTYHMFARGVRVGYRRNPGEGPRFLDYVSDILAFVSRDGVTYEFREVVAMAGRDGSRALEDPRVHRVWSEGREHIVMTYTNLLARDGLEPWRIGMHELVYDGGRFALDEPTGRLLGPSGVPNKDAVVFNLSDGRIALLHRLHPDMQIAVFDSLTHLTSADDAYWDEHLADRAHNTIITPSRGSSSVGAGAPPIATEDGLVLFFHERRADGSYTMNAALLDARTGRVDAMLDEPLMEPELAWERRGDVDNVVFVQGAHRMDDGTIYLTYGAADRCVGVATVSERHLLEALASSSR